MTTTFEDKLREFDRDRATERRQRDKAPSVAVAPGASDGRVARKATAEQAAGGVAQAMEILREKYLDPATVKSLPKHAGMSTPQFRAAFLSAFGRLPGVVRAELQIEHAKRLLKAGAALPTLWERTGFSSAGVFFSAFRTVAGATPTAWLQAEYARDPGNTVRPAPLAVRKPADPDDAPSPAPPAAGWKKGSAANYRQERDRRDRSAAEYANHRPTSSGPKPKAEDLLGAAAFDAHQRRVEEERATREALASNASAASSAAPHHQETRPRRSAAEKAGPINPQFITAVDDTPTAATCFDRFPRDGGRRVRGDFGIGDDVPGNRGEE